MTIENLQVLVADEGMMLTDGKGTYSARVFLGTLDKPENWTEVTVEEYEKAMAEAEAAANASSEELTESEE